MITLGEKAAAWRRRFRRRAGAQEGLTLVEVLVTSLMVGLISFTFIGLNAANSTTADQRQRAKAFTVGESDQERVKGLSADQIAILDQTRTVTSDGTPYTVTSKGQYISSSSSSDSCSSAGAAADYAKVTTTVDWANNTRDPIVIQSVISPRAGGSVVGQTLDQTGAPLSGSTIVVRGSDQNTSSIRRAGTTDANGCTIFGTLLVGDYTVTATRSGYVDKDGNSAPSSAITATSGNTSTSIFSLGVPGKLIINFTAAFGSTNVTASAPAVSYTNNQMATPGVITQTNPATSFTTPANLFPFRTGTATPAVYTGNYSVYAGSCASDAPPTPTAATVGPGATVTLPVKLPALKLIVNGKTSGGTTRIAPLDIEITDACGQNWDETIATNSQSATNGALANPGEPYGPLTVCTSYIAGGNSYKATSNVTNNNLTAGTTLTMTIDTTSTANRGTC